MIKFGLLLFSISFLSATLCLGQNDCVYIAGYTRDANGRQYAAYWKSGQITKLTNGTDRDEARTIAVSGYDVHVGGFKINGGNRVAAYWKNGQQTQLNLIGNYSGKATEVYAIKTVGSDVYMFVTQPNKLSGSDPNNYYYYKNGARQTLLLSDYQAVNEGLVRSGSYFVTRNGDVYILNPSLIDGKITYWKNGTRVAGSQNYSDLNRVDLNSISVSDNGDVYIAGTKILRAGSTKAAYWKNGNEVTLSFESWNTYATGIYVDGSTVYVAGNETKASSHFSAVYWKNGIKTVLHNYDTDSYDATTTSIATGFATVYVVGMHKNNTYWVNSKEAKSDQASGQIYSMAIVKGGGCFNNTSSGGLIAQNTGNVRQQQYNNASNEAKNSLQNGDYVGAAAGFASASATASNKNEEKLAVAGIAISGVTGIVDGLLKSGAKKREKEQIKAEEWLQQAEDRLKQFAEYDEKRKQIFLAIKLVPVEGRKIPDSVTVQSVINRNIKAVGGLEKLKAVKSLTTATIVTDEFSIFKFTTRSIVGYSKFMSVTNYSTGTPSSKTLFNGVRGYSESNNKKTEISSENFATYKEMQPINILMLQQNPNVKLLQELVIFGSGNPCYVLREESKTGTNSYVKTHYFDSVTGLETGVEYLVTSPNNSTNLIYTFYEDYREVDGILFSFKQRNISNYKKYNSYGAFRKETTEIKINDPLAEKEFEY
jgi:hypothetical protein